MTTCPVTRHEIDARLRAACARVAEYPMVEAVVLFGSRARGDHRPDSDWDLAIVGSAPDVEREDLLAPLRPLEDDFDMDLVPLSLDALKDSQSIRHRTTYRECPGWNGGPQEIRHAVAQNQWRDRRRAPRGLRRQGRTPNKTSGPAARRHGHPNRMAPRPRGEMPRGPRYHRPNRPLYHRHCDRHPGPPVLRRVGRGGQGRHQAVGRSRKPIAPSRASPHHPGLS